MKPVNNFLDSVLPTFGNTKDNTPIYDEAQKMFISSPYTSAAGHSYYKGLRFTDRIVMIEKIGTYYNWTYIDGVELYAFNGTEKVLIAKKQFEKEFYNMEQIKREVKQMLFDYFRSQILLKNENASEELIEKHAMQTIDSLYENKIEQIVSYLKQPAMQTLLALEN